jgi:hypothetical protein
MDTSDFPGFKSELDSLSLTRIQRFVEELEFCNGKFFRGW